MHMSQQAAGGCAYRKQHVLFVLVDSSGVRNRVSVFDDGHGLPYRKDCARQLYRIRSLSATGIRPRMGCFDGDGAEKSYTHRGRKYYHRQYHRD